MRPLLGLDGDGTIGMRLTALRALGNNLSVEEQHALTAFLLGTETPPGLGEQQLYWLKNEIMTALRNQDAKPPELTAVLIANYRNRAQDVVIRDYSLQHLSVWYEHAEQQAEIQQVFWEGAEETGRTIAGTALLALQRLAADHPEFDSEQIGQTALALASDASVFEGARVTALQVCARLGVTEALPAAQQLAEGPGSIPLRISAVAALGDLGDEAQMAFLQRVAEGAEARLRPAAQAALKRLTTRLGADAAALRPASRAGGGSGSALKIKEAAQGQPLR